MRPTGEQAFLGTNTSEKRLSRLMPEAKSGISRLRRRCEIVTRKEPHPLEKSAGGTGAYRVSADMLEYGMRPGFIYLDMGNVLLRFSHQRMAEQIAAVCKRPTEQVRQVLFVEGLLWSFERGGIAADDFFEQFSQQLGVVPNRSDLELAASDIFELCVPMVGLIGKLYAAGYPLGLFSNTSPWHWAYCLKRFGVLSTMFRRHALSFELGAMKPDPAAFERATLLAGVAPETIFFTDDRSDNVAAARQAGWDAVTFQSPGQLHEELRQRGVRISY